MSEVLCVRWTILPQEAPQPLLHCARCGGIRAYGSSGRFRVNASGKRIDAWLIYRCTSCDSTWNRPILERRPLRSVPPPLLAALCANDAALVRRLAFDAATLKRCAPRLNEASGFLVVKELLAGSAARPGELHVLCAVPHPVAPRLDRLLADALRLPRSRVHALAASGVLVTSPAAPRVFSRVVRDGMTIRIGLRDLSPVEDANRVALAAID